MNYIEFPKLGIHLDIDPSAVSNLFGTNISIHWYGIIIAAAIMVSLWLAVRHSKKFDIKEDDLIDMFLVALPASIIFARLFFVVFTWNNYKNDLLGIFRIWEGGLAIYGAIIGAILSVYFFSRKRKIDMLNLCDFACVYLPLAQSIGRWGNFANQELYGSVTTLPWGMTGSIIGDDPVHPTFLYESLLNIVVFTVLLRLRKNKKVKGSVLAVYLMLYSFVRFLMEFLRTDEFGTGDIRYNQVFAALVFVGAFIWLIYLTKRSQKVELEAETEDIGPSEYSEIVEKIKKEEQDAEADRVGEQSLDVEMDEKNDTPEAQTSEEVTQNEEQE
ncbi:MAG: prolipoprotein diacylglyceryl transferase [Clostridiaceae bacterium]|nr:prolipoprotein diacylglyceryl transferase [Clostridiaceae bacterium]